MSFTDEDLKRFKNAFRIYRSLLLKTQRMLIVTPKSEAFINGAFRNLRDGLELLKVMVKK